MKTHQHKKHFTVILAVITLFFFSATNAQIVYTNVNPDTSISCNPDSTCLSSYDLDLNNDGVSDFLIMISRTKISSPDCSGNKKNSSVTISPLNGNATNDIKQYSGALISENLGWSTSALQLLGSDIFVCGWCNYSLCWEVWASGSWTTSSDGYLPMRLIVGINSYYGWARLNMGSNSSKFTIKDYAYDSIPNESILAGDSVEIATGISSAKNQNYFFILPNPAFDEITLLFSSSEKKEIQITNTLGQIVFAEKINSAKEEIDVSEFPAGMYAVSWGDGTQWQSKFFSVTK